MNALLEVPVGQLKLAGDNVRQKVGDVSELADSIKAGGVLQPILVNESDNVVVAGARRLAAAKKAGLKVVPVVMREYTEQEKLETMLVENLQREDLSPMEEAAGYQRLVAMGLSQRQIAARVGRSQPTVAKRLSLLALPEKVQAQVVKGTVTLPDAQSLAKLRDDPKAVEAIADGGLGYGSISSKVETELAKKTKEKKREAAAAALRAKGENVLDVALNQYGYIDKLPAGAKEVRKEAYTAEFVEMDPKKHAKAECHAIVLDPRSLAPIEVCTTPANHPNKADEIKAERKKAAAKAAKAKEAFQKMTDHRYEFIQGQVAGRMDKDALLELLWLGLRHQVDYYGYGQQTVDEWQFACELVGVEVSDTTAAADQIEWDGLLDHEAAKSAASRLRAMLAFAIAQFEIALQHDGSWRSEKPYFDWLVSRGYKLSPREKELTNGG